MAGFDLSTYGRFSDVHRGCNACGAAVYFSEREVMSPGARVGRRVESLPGNVASIYEEARRSASTSAFTGCVLLCRTLLSHIAVDRGAKSGVSFQEHVDHLVTTGVLGSTTKAWVDEIRKQGNVATHRLAIATADDAKMILAFAEMVLKLVYEFPAILQPAGAKP